MPFVPNKVQPGADNPESSSVPTPKPKKRGIFSRIGQGISESAKKRGVAMSDTYQQTKSGDINPLQTAVRSIGGAAGFIGDVAATGVMETAKEVLPDKAEESISKSFSNAIAKSDIPKLMAEYDSWKANNPEAAKDLEGVVNIASLLPAEKALGIGLKSAKAGAKVAGESLETAGRATAKGLAQGVETTVKTGGFIEKHALSQATGYRPETIMKIINDPGAFDSKTTANISRGSVGERVQTGIQGRLDELSDTGKEYQAIRDSDALVNIPEETVPSILEKYGLQIVDEGGVKRIKTSAESVPLKSGDISAIEDFLNQYGNQPVLSSNAFLNSRKALDNLSSFGAEKTDISDLLARDLRSAYDSLGKKQIDGLANLDAKFSPEVKLLKQLRKDYLNPDGTLKDNALNKVANLTGKGKDRVIERLEKVVPGIAEDINILKAIEDIADASQRPGTYVKGAVLGTALAPGVGTIVGILLTTPQVAVPMLRAYGRLKGISGEIINSVINKLRAGKPLVKSEKSLVASAMKEYDGKEVA